MFTFVIDDSDEGGKFPIFMADGKKVLAWHAIHNIRKKTSNKFSIIKT